MSGEAQQFGHHPPPVVVEVVIVLEGVDIPVEITVGPPVETWVDKSVAWTKDSSHLGQQSKPGVSIAMDDPPVEEFDADEELSHSSVVRYMGEIWVLLSFGKWYFESGGRIGRFCESLY